MKSNFSKGLLMTALITGSVIWGGTNVFAEELQEYSLEQMVVTAMRTEKKDLDIPAVVEVYDEEQIEKSNAANAYDVLQNTLGVNTQSQGFNGTGMGTMTSKVMIRAVEKGSLVLVNGVPMNQDGKYNLEDIPTESIEKIEVKTLPVRQAIKSQLLNSMATFMSGSLINGNEQCIVGLNIIQKDKKEIWIPFHEGSVTRFNLDYHQYVKNARELKDKILKYIIKTQE